MRALFTMCVHVRICSICLHVCAWPHVFDRGVTPIIACLTVVMAARSSDGDGARIRDSETLRLDYDLSLKRWVASNQLTGERVALRVGPVWNIDFDEEGDGYFWHCAAEDEILLAEELFSAHTYRMADGRVRLVRTKKNTHEQDLGPNILSEVLSWHKTCTVQFKYGVTDATGSVTVAIFKLRRTSCKVFWSIPHVYGLAGLKSKKTAARWIQSLWAGWLRRAPAAHLVGHLVKSIPYNCYNDPSRLDDTRVLRNPSWSTCALIFFLAGYAFQQRHEGGSKSSLNAAAAAIVLDGLFTSMRDGAWELPLYIDPEVQIDWPRPWRGNDLVFLQVDASGRVNVDNCFALVRPEYRGGVRELSVGVCDSRWWCYVCKQKKM